MVFTGVNDGKDPDTVGGLDSDDELELELHRHKPESKMMVAELRHVIESNPTCLYEDDYEEFKQTGLLNPTESELKVRFSFILYLFKVLIKYAVEMCDGQYLSWCQILVIFVILGISDF